MENAEIFLATGAGYAIKTQVTKTRTMPPPAEPRIFLVSAAV